MANLPDLVLERILHYAAPLVGDDHTTHGPEVARLASTCPFFQQVIEKKTFRTIHLDRRRIAAANTILFRYPHRINCVKSIRFTAILPEYDAHACTRFETEVEKLINSRIFTNDTVRFFDLLFRIDAARPSYGMDLHITAQSPTDDMEWSPVYSRNVRKTLDRPLLWDLEHWRYCMSPVRLLEQHANFSKTGFPFIRTLWLLGADYCRYLDAETMGLITSRFSNLKCVEWDFWDCEKHDLDLRRANRSNLADAIKSFQPSIKELRLWCEYFPPGNQINFPPTMLMLDETEDRFTKAIRQASQNLEILQLQGVLGSPQLFWPKHPRSEQNLPFWPFLRELNVKYHIVTPDGKWLFEEDVTPNPRQTSWGYQYHHDDSKIPSEEWPPNQFRYSPTQHLLDELYLAVAYAVARMPKLHVLSLSSTNFEDGELYSTSIHNFFFKLKERTATATWCGFPKFIPSDKVVEAWKKAAYERDINLVFQFKEETRPLKIGHRGDSSDSEDDDDDDSNDDDSEDDDGEDDGGDEDSGGNGSEDDGTNDS